MKPAAVPFLIAWLALMAVFSGCAGSRIDGSHPLLSRQAGGEVARVYFIRPRTERYLGVADNVVRIEADRKPLLELVKAEYALVYLKPGKTWIMVTSDTSWGPAHDIKEMSRMKEFEFAAGQTYYISITAVDGEFRGVYFSPEGIDLDQAKQIAGNLRAAGSAARGAPIDRL